MVQAPSLLGANIGSPALEDADTVGGSRLDMTICSPQSLSLFAVYWTGAVFWAADHCSITA